MTSTFGGVHLVLWLHRLSLRSACTSCKNARAAYLRQHVDDSTARASYLRQHVVDSTASAIARCSGANEIAPGLRSLVDVAYLMVRSPRLNQIVF